MDISMTQLTDGLKKTDKLVTRNQLSQEHVISFSNSLLNFFYKNTATAPARLLYPFFLRMTKESGKRTSAAEQPALMTFSQK